MLDYFDVVATVVRPWGETSEHSCGTLEAWVIADGIPAAWKRMRKAMVFDECGHYAERGDGWRVSFKSTPCVDE